MRRRLFLFLNGGQVMLNIRLLLPSSGGAGPDDVVVSIREGRRDGHGGLMDRHAWSADIFRGGASRTGETADGAACIRKHAWNIVRTGALAKALAAEGET